MSVNLRFRKLKSGKKSYYLDIHHNGRRWREFLKVTISPYDQTRNEKKKIIEKIRIIRELELLSEDTGHIPIHFRKLDFFVFAEDFLSCYRKRDGRMIEGSIKKFKKFLQSPTLPISKITPGIMENFKDYLIYDAGLTGETPHNYFTRFKKLLKAAKIKGYLKDMPTEHIRFTNPNKNDTIKKQVVNAEELQQLADTMCGNNEVKKAFLFACYTSLGLAEIRDLKWVNIKNGRLITKRKKTGEIINNRLNLTALKIIGRRKEDIKYIFDLQSLSVSSVNKDIKYWSKRANIDKHLTFYCARHTFACLLLLNGANLKTVADALGHRSTRSTLKYLNYVQKLQDEAIDNLPSINLKNDLMKIV
jgi:integrase